MLKIISKWVHRYFSDEEALLLFVLLAVSLLVILTLGKALAPVFFSIILAFLMQGAVQRCTRYMPHKVAVLLVFTSFMAAFLAFMLLVLPQVWRQLLTLLNETPRIMSEIQKVLLLLPERYPELVSEQQVRQLIAMAASEIGRAWQWALTFSLHSITNIVALLIYLILVPILVFFFMKDGNYLAGSLTAYLPEKRDMMRRIWTEMDAQIANYIRGKVIEILIVGAVSYVVFVFLGLNYAALLALMVGLSVVIPYIGAAVVTLPVAGVAFFQWGWGSEFITLMIAYFVIQALDGNVLVPILFSEAVNLHPVSIIVAVLLFGSLWGVLGVFFAIPLATLIKSIVNAWPRALEHVHEESQGPPDESVS
ncbi:MAG: AI-2E family transporter [Nitrincola lacisaponensis]|uniref:Putative permease PerM n=1 Tax=Nitrincola lacisaponensis TaxID=267850 RepID=A0A063XZN9_9GAMM|nr:AI-2E family transporter [Nitrincola lacisaponensis]KDE38400.1 putative permease PerM [Nitrincola lacisaponensis]